MNTFVKPKVMTNSGGFPSATSTYHHARFTRGPLSGIGPHPFPIGIERSQSSDFSPVLQHALNMGVRWAVKSAKPLFSALMLTIALLPLYETPISSISLAQRSSRQTLISSAVFLQSTCAAEIPSVPIWVSLPTAKSLACCLRAFTAGIFTWWVATLKWVTELFWLVFPSFI